MHPANAVNRASIIRRFIASPFAILRENQISTCESSLEGYRVSLSKQSQRAKYADLGAKALAQTESMVREAFGADVVLRGWTAEAFIAVDKQWEGGRFDWAHVKALYKNQPDRLEIAIWLDDILLGMALATTTGEAVYLRCVEGHPGDGLPLQGQRLLVALDATTNYCQLRGRYEVRVEPKNDELVDLYQNVYGFTPVIPKKGTPYWSKKVD